MNFLNYQNWKVTKVEESEQYFTVQAIYQSSKSECNICLSGSGSGLVIRYGKKLKIIRDASAFGKPVWIYLVVQRFLCKKCKAVFCPAASEVSQRYRLTTRLVEYIEKNSLKKSFTTISQDTGVSKGTVREIFVSYIERNCRSFFDETPQILRIDEVYIKRIARCILTDIDEKKVIEILPKRDMLTVFRHLLQMKNKKKVKYVVMDMWRPFHKVITKVFPNAKIIIDKFHVQRMSNEAINIYLRHIRDSTIQSELKKHFRNRFILMKSYYKLTRKEKTLLSKWLKQFPELSKVYRLKEDFLKIWKKADRKKAERFYLSWKKKIPANLEFVFKNIISTVDRWHREIFNYFDFRVTNAYTESANCLIKTMQRNGRSYSFEVIRAKLLYGIFSRNR